MKTKILTAIAITGLLTSAVYAQDVMNNSFKDNKTQMKMMKKNHHKKDYGFKSILRQLNLTAEQKEKIFEIKKEMMKERQSVNVAFTKTSFDKEKFLEIMKQKRENMLESKAEMISKIYAVLTAEQKEQVKVLMDLKKEKRMAMLDKRMSFDKNCNGRR